MKNTYKKTIALALLFSMPTATFCSWTSVAKKVGAAVCLAAGGALAISAIKEMSESHARSTCDDLIAGTPSKSTEIEARYAYAAARTNYAPNDFKHMIEQTYGSFSGFKQAVERDRDALVYAASSLETIANRWEYADGWSTRVYHARNTTSRARKVLGAIEQIVYKVQTVYNFNDLRNLLSELESKRTHYVNPRLTYPATSAAEDIERDVNRLSRQINTFAAAQTGTSPEAELERNARACLDALRQYHNEMLCCPAYISEQQTRRMEQRHKEQMAALEESNRIERAKLAAQLAAANNSSVNVTVYVDGNDDDVVVYEYESDDDDRL